MISILHSRHFFMRWEQSAQAILWPHGLNRMGTTDSEQIWHSILAAGDDLLDEGFDFFDFEEDVAAVGEALFLEGLSGIVLRV